LSKLVTCGALLHHAHAPYEIAERRGPGGGGREEHETGNRAGGKRGGRGEGDGARTGSGGGEKKRHNKETWRYLIIRLQPQLLLT